MWKLGKKVKCFLGYLKRYIHICRNGEYEAIKPDDPEAGEFSLEEEFFVSVCIGKQLWMASDLDVPIDHEIGRVWTVPGYGRLYDWEAAKMLCPEGWRLPTDEDWIRLECELGMPEREARLKIWGCRNSGGVGEQMKENGNSGLNMLLRGYCTVEGIFREQGLSGCWWSSAPHGGYAIVRMLRHSAQGVFRTYVPHNGGRSVRYVKDLPEGFGVKK